MRHTDIVALLPRVVQRSVLPGDPLDALLAVMEGLHSSTEQVLAERDALVRPWRAPESMLPYLASWLDLDAVLSPDATGAWQLPSGPAQLRALLEAGADIARWRGTSRGMKLFLEAATGVAGFSILERVSDDAGEVVPFTIRVIVPPAAASMMGLIERVVATAKPAYLQSQIALAAESDPPAPPLPEPPAALLAGPPGAWHVQPAPQTEAPTMAQSDTGAPHA